MDLPLPPPGPGRCLARGVLLDYHVGTISPCTLPALARVLSGVERYGVHRPVGTSCDVLTHSVAVGNLAARLGRIVGCSSAMRSALHLYGRLHDVGESLGGDVTSQVPMTVLGPFRAWQAHVRANICAGLGLPTPSLFVQALVKIADLAVCPAEIVAFGGFGGGGATFETVLRDMETQNGFCTKLVDRLSAVPGLEKETVEDLAAEAAALYGTADRAAREFCRGLSFVLGVDAEGQMTGAWASLVEAAEADDDAIRFIVTRPLFSGSTAESYTRSQVHGGHPVSP